MAKPKVLKNNPPQRLNWSLSFFCKLSLCRLFAVYCLSYNPPCSASFLYRVTFVVRCEKTVCVCERESESVERRWRYTLVSGCLCAVNWSERRKRVDEQLSCQIKCNMNVSNEKKSDRETLFFFYIDRYACVWLNFHSISLCSSTFDCSCFFLQLLLSMLFVTEKNLFRWSLSFHRCWCCCRPSCSVSLSFSGINYLIGIKYYFIQK